MALIHAIIQGPRLMEDVPSSKLWLLLPQGLSPFLPVMGEKNVEDKARESFGGQVWKWNISYLFTVSLARVQSYGYI